MQASRIIINPLCPSAELGSGDDRPTRHERAGQMVDEPCFASSRTAEKGKEGEKEREGENEVIALDKRFRER